MNTVNAHGTRPRADPAWCKPSRSLGRRSHHRPCDRVGLRACQLPNPPLALPSPPPLAARALIQISPRASGPLGSGRTGRSPAGAPRPPTRPTRSSTSGRARQRRPYSRRRRRRRRRWSVDAATWSSPSSAAAASRSPRAGRATRRRRRQPRRNDLLHVSKRGTSCSLPPRAPPSSASTDKRGERPAAGERHAVRAALRRPASGEEDF